MVFTMLCKVAIPLLHDTLADPVAPGAPHPENA